MARHVRHASRLGSMLLTLTALSLASSALAGKKSVASSPPFREGDVIGYDAIAALEKFLPPEFWAHRDLFLYEGMKLEIGPSFRDYGQPPEYLAATERFEGQAKIGPDESLENYTAGFVFDPASIDCEGDPQAGVKHIWNFAYQWEGDGSSAHFLYTYRDRGERLPLYYEGTSKTVALSHRIEADLLDTQGGDLFRGEKRVRAAAIEVAAPFDARGIMSVTYRYKESEKPLAQSKSDDTWIYRPTLRRVRRISAPQRTDAVAGTDFAFDDLRSFAGIVPHYTWSCLGRIDLFAPMNSKVKAYPYSADHEFGPSGLSYADDRWELRHAVKVRMRPKNADHPYDHKDIYLDAQTYVPLYSFAYDRNETLWKIIWHNHRWSEDDSIRKEGETEWYESWPGVDKPLDLRTVSDTIVNVQTFSGTRIEYWDDHGTPLKNAEGAISRGKVRRLFDLPVRHCVAAGTPIATPNGPLPIEELEIGDAVWSWDEARGVRVVARVEATHASDADETLVFGGALRVTAEHPLLASGVWTEAADVEPDAMLLHLESGPVRAGAPEVVSRPVRVFDLTIDGPANFFAGGLLVHNKRGR